MSDPRLVFNHGDQFLRAGERCLEQRDAGDGKVEALPLAAAVDLAFSVELFTKAAILAAGGVPPKNHRIARLFDALSDEARASAQSMYRPGCGGGASFDEAVAFANDLFERVRYFYEDGAAILYQSSVLELARACRQAFAGLVRPPG